MVDLVVLLDPDRLESDFFRFGVVLIFPFQLFAFSD